MPSAKKIIASIILIPFIVVFLVGFISLLSGNIVDGAMFCIVVDGGLIYLYVRILRKNKRQLAKKETELTENNWTKLHDDFFINQEEQKILVNNKEIEFKKIASVELLQDEETRTVSFGNNYGKIKNKAVFPGLKMTSTSISSGVSDEWSFKLDIAIEIKDNFLEPIIFYKFIKNSIPKKGKKYKEIYDNAIRIMMILNSVIESNKKTLN